MKYSEIHLAAFTERSNRFIARCRLLESGEDYHSCKKYRAVQRIITSQRSSSGKSSTV